MDGSPRNISERECMLDSNCQTSQNSNGIPIRPFYYLFGAFQPSEHDLNIIYDQLPHNDEYPFAFGKHAKRNNLSLPFCVKELEV